MDLKKLEQFEDEDGFLRVILTNDDGQRVCRRVHELVAAAWLPNPEAKKRVRHKDGNKRNNAVANLEWCD